MLNMELGEGVIQVRSTVKHEKDYPSFTQDDVVFLFGDIVRPVGLVLNNNNPLECFVLFPPAAPMQDIIDLPEVSSWVGTSMHLMGRFCMLPAISSYIIIIPMYTLIY